MTERDEEADFDLLLDLIDEHIASPDREALQEMLRDWQIIVQIVAKMGLISRESLPLIMSRAGEVPND